MPSYYKTQRYKNADALYAFKSRGFGGEIGLGTPTIDPGLDASREIMDYYGKPAK